MFIIYTLNYMNRKVTRYVTYTKRKLVRHIPLMIDLIVFFFFLTNVNK